MACSLLDHILSPWGVPSRKQGECLFGVILLVSRVLENGLEIHSSSFGMESGHASHCGDVKGFRSEAAISY
jgi:hypothetical protein